MKKLMMLVVLMVIMLPCISWADEVVAEGEIILSDYIPGETGIGSSMNELERLTNEVCSYGYYPELHILRFSIQGSAHIFSFEKK